MFNALKTFLRVLGPGIITGAADDDPSGIATCSRIGVVTGKGIAAVVREHFSKPVLYIVVLLVLIANTINIGADIGAMAAAAGLLFPCPLWRSPCSPRRSS